MMREDMAEWLIEPSESGNVWLTHMPTRMCKEVEGPVDMEILLRLIDNWSF